MLKLDKKNVGMIQNRGYVIHIDIGPYWIDKTYCNMHGVCTKIRVVECAENGECETLFDKWADKSEKFLSSTGIMFRVEQHQC